MTKILRGSAHRAQPRSRSPSTTRPPQPRRVIAWPPNAIKRDIAPPGFVVYSCSAGAVLRDFETGRSGSMALRTTVVGSWWKLDEHEDERARSHRGELDSQQGDDL